MPRENLRLAFDIAERVYNVTPLLDPEGIDDDDDDDDYFYTNIIVITTKLYLP